jgi:putative lipoprotein
MEKLMRCWFLIALVVIGVLALVGCGDSGGASVTGEVTYRERIALPDDAVVTVQIQDISLMGVAATVIGEQVIEAGGDQTPFPYEVEYNEDEIIENHTYSMSARITDGEGKLLFISDTANLVITNGNPTSDVLILTVQVGGA